MALSVEPQGPASERYVEDCPVCCRPWRVEIFREADQVAVTLTREDD